MRPFAFVPARPWVALVAVCLLVPLGVRADDPDHEKVTVKIRPVVLFAGGQVRTTVRTPRDPRNRELRVIVEGEDYYASSDVQLDGVDAATTHQFTWKELPGGGYRVDAILLRADGEKTTVTECFAVLSGDDNESSTVGTGQAFPTRRRQQRPLPKPESTGVKTGC
jgi:hypothetical protein